MSAPAEVRNAAVEAILARGPKHAAQRIVLLELAVAADPATRIASMPMCELASAAGVCERYARMVISDLEADGWLRRRIGRGRGRANTYELNIEIATEGQA